MSASRRALGLVLLSAIAAGVPGAAGAAQGTPRPVTVHVDMRGPLRAGWFDPRREVVGLRGDTAPLSWERTLPAADPDADGVYDVVVTLPAGRAVAFKVKVDGEGNPNDGWETGENRALPVDTPEVRIAPSYALPARSVVGRVDRYPEFASRFVRARDVLVWLPPGYARGRGRRYPVLYLHDGQNLFDGTTSFQPGREWMVDETATRLVRAGAVEPVIIVGVANAGDRRIWDYTPVPDPKYGGGGADAYGRFLVEELKPFVDRTYRTRTGPADTGLGGSSLGGLVSLYLGLKFPAVFGKLLVVSPSVWWAGEAILRDVRGLARPTGQRLWVDIGTAEGDEAVGGARHLRDALVTAGWREGGDLRYVEVEGARHDEAAWAGRAGAMLEFLFPGRPARRGTARVTRPAST